MIAYIIKSGLCSLLLLFVYRISLQREKMYAFNRAYLLFSLVFSSLIPLVTFQVTNDAPAMLDDIFPPGLWETATNAADPAAPTITAVTPAITTWSPSIIASLGYAAISIILLCRFFRNLYHIRKATANQQYRKYEEAQLILTDKTITAHSFLHYIFMSKADYNDPVVREALLTHELSHVRQKHSWDILFVETLQIFCWINPTL